MPMFARRSLLVVLVILWAADATSAAQEAGPTGMPCKDPEAILRQSQFKLDVGPVRLKDGKDCPTEPGIRCQWQVTLERVESWGTAPRFLLVIVNANHLTGSGAWDSVFLYACHEDVFVPSFAQRFLSGARVELGKQSDFWLTAGEWRQEDPVCCASRQRRSRYMWNPRQRVFAVAESTVTARKRPGN